MLAMGMAMGHESGCTPGYWKNNATTAVWGPTGYSPDQELGTVFNDTATIEGVAPFGMVNWDKIGIDPQDTLLQALNYGGGSGISGAAKILLRAAVAALLNGAHPNVDGFPPAWVIKRTVGYLNGVEGQGLSYRGNILWLATMLDGENNSGCPLDAFGRVVPK
jgi:hypothetical protein